MTIRHDLTLADGRELFYYDAEPGEDRSTPDQRDDLSLVSSTSDVRWNPLFRDLTVIAEHRQTRTYRPPAELCPLCPSRPGRPTEVPASDYQVAVFQNRFPSFAEQPANQVPYIDDPPFRSGPGDGRCEVVCFSSDHGSSFAQLSEQRARTIIDAWADRTTSLSALNSIDYIFCFENRGQEIGVTLSHPHGQIYAYPFVPPRFFNAATSARDYQYETGQCLQCTMLESELKNEARIVVESDDWVVYVPFAARWPYEVRIVPRRHVPDLPSLTDTERDDLAGVYLDALARFDRLFDTPAPYIASWQQAPVRHHRDSWHLAAEIFTIRRAPGKLKYLAGSESAGAVWINDVSPELAAAKLRGE